MNRTVISAIVEGGVFRPLSSDRLPFGEGQRVELVVRDAEELPTILKLATEVYEGLSEEDIDEIESIALERRDYFGRGETT